MALFFKKELKKNEKLRVKNHTIKIIKNKKVKKVKKVRKD